MQTFFPKRHGTQLIFERGGETPTRRSDGTFASDRPRFKGDVIVEYPRETSGESETHKERPRAFFCFKPLQKTETS